MSIEPPIDKIRSFIVREFPLARGRSLGAADRLLQSGILDSLGVLKLVGYLETEFGITVDDEDLVPDNFDSLGQLAEFVAQKQTVASSEPA